MDDLVFKQVCKMLAPFEKYLVSVVHVDCRKHGCSFSLEDKAAENRVVELLRKKFEDKIAVSKAGDGVHVIFYTSIPKVAYEEFEKHVDRIAAMRPGDGIDIAFSCEAVYDLLACYFDALPGTYQCGHVIGSNVVSVLLSGPRAAL